MTVRRLVQGMGFHARLLCALYGILGAVAPCLAANEREWPFWDGSESVVSYAARVHLEPTQSISLGDGITMVLVFAALARVVDGGMRPDRRRRRAMVSRANRGGALRGRSSRFGQALSRRCGRPRGDPDAAVLHRQIHRYPGPILVARRR